MIGLELKRSIEGMSVLKQRFITAVILAPLVLLGLFTLEPWPFSWFVGAVVGLAAWEWANLAGYQTQTQRIIYALILCGLTLLAAYLPVLWVLVVALVWWLCATALVLTYPANGQFWQAGWAPSVIGLLVLIPFWKALVFIRTAELTLIPEVSTLWVILYMLLMVWAADVGAYFAGKTWGKSKLAPQVSPGKSWAGAWGGLVASGLLAFVVSIVLGVSSAIILQLIAISIFSVVVSIIGDLTESMFKRHRGIKDSSQLLPGHGGVMDRIDSLTAAVPVFVLLLVISGWVA